jgi:hypothetical protein
MKLGTGHAIVASRCLHCGAELTGATAVGADATPNPGDITVCLACGHIMAFTDDLTLRAPTDAEAYEVAGDQRILAIQRARAALEPKL